MTWDEGWDDECKCVCGETNVVTPTGPATADILIIGGIPEDEEIKMQEPFFGSQATILHSELSKAGVDPHGIRYCCIALHKLDKKDKNKAQKCLDYGMAQVIKEAKSKRAILLVGAEVMKQFCPGLSVEKWNGLLVKSNLLSCPIVVACIKPSTVFAGTIGEFRFAIRQFAKRIDNE